MNKPTINSPRTVFLRGVVIVETQGVFLILCVWCWTLHWSKSSTSSISCKLYLHCSMWETSRAALLSWQVRLPLDKSCFICKAKRYLHTDTHTIRRISHVRKSIYRIYMYVWGHRRYSVSRTRDLGDIAKCYLVRLLLSCPGSGGKNFTINLKKRSLVSDREKKKKQKETCRVKDVEGK